MLLSVQNTLDIQANNSYLTTDLASGGTVVPVRNINNFAASWAIQIGKTGEEQSEILTLSPTSPSGTALNTTGTLRFSHPKDTPVYNIHFDKVVFKVSSSGTAGTATAISGGTTLITPDSEYTEYDYTSGASTDAYKTQFYNSANADVSSESDWFIPTGPTFYSLQKLRNRTKNKLFSAGYIKEDSVIDDWINEWVEEMTNSAVKVNKQYSMGTVAVSFGTAGYGTITSSDFKYANKLEVTYDGSSYVPASKSEPNRISDDDVYSLINPIYYWEGDTVFNIRPNNTSGTARISYYKLPAVLENETDELPLSLRGYTKGCVSYCLYTAYLNDEKDSLAAIARQDYLSSKTDFISEITPRDFTGAQSINLIDSLSGRDEDIVLDDFVF